MAIQERPPTSENNTHVGEFTADRQTWDNIATRCETILGGVDGKKLSQKTWTPDDQPGALAKFGMTYGVDLILARLGQTEPTPDTMYELTVTGHNYGARYLFTPYKEYSIAHVAYDQPEYVLGGEQSSARLSMLTNYLNTYLGEANG